VKISSAAILFVLAAFDLRSAPLIESNPQREMILANLQKLVDRDGTLEANHFFLLRRKDGVDWIFWREGRRLWNTTFEPYIEEKGAGEIRARAVWGLRLLAPRDVVELDSDVANNDEEARNNRFAMPKAKADEIVFDCVVNGELVEIHKGPSLLPGIPNWTLQQPAPTR
jgi:hypothetical protein